MFRTVSFCTPEPFATIVPAIPDDSMRRRTHRKQAEQVGRFDRGESDDFRGGTLSVGQVRLADLFADRDHNALPTNHRAQTQRDRHGKLDPGRE